MTDKVQKILSKIETRKLCTMDEHMAFYNDKAKEDYMFLSEIEEFIKASQEEPVIEDAPSEDYVRGFADGRLYQQRQKPSTSVWHDASELPDNSEAIVIEHSEYGTSIVTACRMSRVKGAKWALIEDILKL